MGSNYTRMLQPPHHLVRVDVEHRFVEQRRLEGWIDDPFPDDRELIARNIIGRHKGRAAFVVAAGPSAGMFLPEQVNELASLCVTWGVNHAWEVLGGEPLDADYLLILDDHFLARKRTPIFDYLAARPHCLPCFGFEMKEALRHYFVGIEMGLTPDQGPDYKPGRYFHGNSGGVAAIQMALHCGCSRVYLLGHDCCTANGKTHGFGVRTTGELNAGYSQGLTMEPGYGLVARHAGSLGVEVVNLSPVSRLSCFKKCTLEEAIQNERAEAVKGGG